MRQYQYLTLVVGLFTATLVVTNVLNTKLFMFFGFALPAGIITFPLSFLVDTLVFMTVAFVGVYPPNTTLTLFISSWGSQGRLGDSGSPSERARRSLAEFSDSGTGGG